MCFVMQSAEALKNWTWQDAVDCILLSRVIIFQGRDGDHKTWVIALLSNKSEEYKNQFQEEKG